MSGPGMETDTWLEDEGLDSASSTGHSGLAVELSAVLVVVANDEPQALVRRSDSARRSDALPAGPFEPVAHRTLEGGLRSWVREQTHLNLGYVEQLYTFGDRGRHPREARGGPRVISVGYLALTRADPSPRASDALWRDWYRYFPWEDWRVQRPAMIDKLLVPRLEEWAGAAPRPAQQTSRRDRARLCFGFDGLAWDPEKVLERYELLYEAGLVLEAARDRMEQIAAPDPAAAVPPRIAATGEPMFADHRRILATAIGRLRGKLKYRPVVFELMPPTFTLFQLQRTVQAIAGVKLHKQNFRRLVERSGLVEGTGKIAATGSGRPAEEFRFRPEVVRERAAPGVHVPRPRGGH